MPKPPLESWEALAVKESSNLKNRKMTISKSIIERTSLILKSNPAMDILEATKQAIIEEQKFISEMIEQKTDRSRQALNVLRKNTYAIIHAIN